MQHRTLTYQDNQQTLISQLFYPESKTPLPGVLVFPAFEGLSEFSLEYAKLLAEQGYAAMAVDIYGDGAHSETLQGCLDLYMPFSDDRTTVRRRAELAHTEFCKQAEVDNTCINAIGFCFGGLCALELARSGTQLHAVVGFHAGLPKSELDTQPITAKILMLHGYKDPQMPPSMLADFAEEMQQAGVKDWTFTYFGEAQHSFTDPKTGTFDPEKEPEMGRFYDPVAAKRSMAFMLEFLREKPE